MAGTRIGHRALRDRLRVKVRVPETGAGRGNRDSLHRWRPGRKVGGFASEERIREGQGLSRKLQRLGETRRGG